MLKFSFNCHLLHNNGLTFAVARTLFQRVQYYHQVLCCPDCVIKQQRLRCCEDKFVSQKQWLNDRKCSFDIHMRGFYSGKASYEKANKKSYNVAAIYEDREQFEGESSKDLGVELVDRSVKEIFKRKSKHKNRIDVSKYMDNVVDEITDLERNSSKIHVPKQVVPTYYKPKSITETLLEEKEAMEKEVYIGNIDQSDIAEVSEQEQLMLAERGEFIVKDVKKVSMPSSISLDMIVNDSKVLQDLVKLGVDLKSLQKRGMIETVMRLHSKKEMAPYIFFLRDNGVPEDEVGRLITRCPWIFQHSLHNLRVRMNYLRSKKFNNEDFSNMFERDPKFLLIPIQRMDARLGYIQRQFGLTGDQIRSKVQAYSKLIIAPSLLLKQNMIILEKSLGFSPEELKTMFLDYPKIFHKDCDMVARLFDYVHNVMGIPHELIAKTPRVLNTSKRKLDSRHRFLVKSGRDQYDPTKENYVSLMSLITKSDDEWCFEVAKSSVAEFNNFLKTI